MRALLEYSWPGNVRELRNVVRRVLLTCPARTIGRKDVVPHLSPGGTSPYSGEGLERDESQLVLRLPARRSFNEIIEECERVVLLNALKECAWNKSKVTQVLKIPRQSLYNKIARYKLERRWGAAPD
jgi:two-component system response regulator HydG